MQNFPTVTFLTFFWTEPNSNYSQLCVSFVCWTSTLLTLDFSNFQIWTKTLNIIFIDFTSQKYCSDSSILPFHIPSFISCALMTDSCSVCKERVRCHWPAEKECCHCCHECCRCQECVKRVLPLLPQDVLESQADWWCTRKGNWEAAVGYIQWPIGGRGIRWSRNNLNSIHQWSLSLNLISIEKQNMLRCVMCH